ncbi:MAG: efflux RND transporter periplasmic adaptor subunit [Syntrophobacterales bacterium]
MKRIFLIVLVVGALVALGVWLYWENQQGDHNVLRLSGHIEATETDLGFKVPGKIAAIYFEEGQEVKAGEVVAKLESQDLRQELDAAQARLQAAKANAAKLEAGYRPQEVREAQAAVAQAQADYNDKAKDYWRKENLFKRKVVTGSSRDKAEAAYLMAKESLRRAQETYDLRKSGYRKEDIEAARADFRQAQAALQLAQTRLGYATITSPVNAVVLARPVEPGHVAAVGATVLTLGDLDHAYFEGYIPETDLARVRYGLRAEVTTDSYPGKRYPAWVSYISSKAEFTPKSVETFKERVTLVYRTKIRVENQSHELKPGMPAEAYIFLNEPPIKSGDGSQDWQ